MTTNAPRNDKFQGVIFDIDGVLVDTRRSYLEAIRITTELYLTEILGLKKNGTRLMSLKDVELFKMLGGVNNDWDCVRGLLFYFLSLAAPLTGHHLRSLSLADLTRKKNIPGLLSARNKGFLRSKKAATVLSQPTIIQIFQEVYLGSKLYGRHYKKRSFFWKKAGLYLKETPLLTASFFQGLKKRGLKLGIATGRNRFETLMVLDRFGWKRFFSSIVTADEVPPKFSKPHPYVLIQNGKRLKIRNFIYVGDLPDDMKAARRANAHGLTVTSIGFLKGVDQKSAMRDELLRAGASRTARNTSELKNFLGNYGPFHS